MVKMMLKKNKTFFIAAILTFIFAANVFAIAGSFVVPKNATDTRMKGSIKTSAISFLNVTSPTATSKWYVTGQYEIQWTWAEFFYTDVDLFLYKGTTKELMIDSEVYSAMNNYYGWQVPSNLTTASNYKIYVQESSNFSDNASSAPFTINATLFLANCSSAPIVYLGGADTINWVGTVSAVDIDLYKSSTHVQSIASNYPSYSYTGIEKEYPWTVPKTLAGGSDYRFKVTAHGNSSIYVYSPYFTVNTEKMIFNVGLPYMVYTTSICNIYWQSIGNIQHVDIDLYNGGTLVQNIATSAPDNENYFWSVPGTLTPLATYVIRVSDHDNPALYYNSSSPFTINATHAINYVYVSSMVYLGGSLHINWGSSPPVKSVDIILYQGSSQIATIASNFVNTGGYNWHVTGSYSSGTNYRIEVVDHDQPSISMFSGSFIINASRQITNVYFGSVVQAGNVGLIQWNYYGLISSVDIQLYKSGLFVETIVQNEPNGGSYSWLVSQSHVLGSNYTIKVLDHGQPADNAMSSAFNITAYVLPQMPWGVSTGENLKWTVGFNVVMNFPDEFWQSLDALLGASMPNVHSKDIYNAFKAALPNSWHVKASVESLVHNGDMDNVIASVFVKENTNNTYATLGSYVGQFYQKMKNALGPFFSFIFPGDLPSINTDLGNHVPISSAQPSFAPFDFPGISSMPSPILPTNYSFSNNWNKMVAAVQNDSSFISQFGSWSGFQSMTGFSGGANATGMHGSLNALTMNNYERSMFPFMPGMGPVDSLLEELSTVLNANLTLSSLLANGSVNYNSSMVLQKLAGIAVAQGKFTLPNGNGYDFTMSVEIYAFQGELSSITYIYHDLPSGVSLTAILLIVGLVGGVGAVIVVVSITQRRRRL